MEVLFPRCAGLDLHKKSVVACCRIQEPGQPARLITRTFSTMTRDLLSLADWLELRGCTHVAMESTGEYWRPVYNLLEGRFEILLANAHHVKNVPGRKTDVKDAEWIAELLAHGLLRPSFVPPAAQRELRDLTRHRANFIRERASMVNRVQKTLEGANIKLASVASDVLGVSGKAMLLAMIQGVTDPVVLAALAKGKLQNKYEDLLLALEGRIQPHHRLILSELIRQIEGLDASISRLDEEIEKRCRPFEEAIARLDTIPGVARATAELILSEVGTDMSRFRSAAHLAAWAGVAPGNNESAGKKLSGKSRKGNRALRTGLLQAAHAAARKKGCYLGAQYRRLAARRGNKRANVAVAHSIIVIAYHLLVRNQDYQEKGADYFDKLKPEATAKRLIARLETLGYRVADQPTPQPA